MIMLHHYDKLRKKTDKFTCEIESRKKSPISFIDDTIDFIERGYILCGEINAGMIHLKPDSDVRPYYESSYERIRRSVNNSCRAISNFLY